MLSFYEIFMCYYYYITQVQTDCLRESLLPVQFLYISSCFLAACCMVSRCRLKAEDLRLPETLLKLMEWIWLGDMYSRSWIWHLRSRGRQFSCSHYRNGLGIKYYCYLDLRIFQARLELRLNLLLKLCSMSGELLKLFIYLKTEITIILYTHKETIFNHKNNIIENKIIENHTANHIIFFICIKKPLQISLQKQQTTIQSIKSTQFIIPDLNTIIINTFSFIKYLVLAQQNVYSDKLDQYLMFILIIVILISIWFRWLCYPALQFKKIMKINIKTLKGEVLTLEIDPTKNIADLKQLIKNERGIATQSQKIIFKGKTTTNEDIIEKLGVKQTDFLVVMNQIAKPQPKPKVEEKAEEIKPKSEQKKEVKEQKKEVNKPAQQQQNQAQINQLMVMGFPREQCVAALKAAYNNSQRAVQFLLNGIPSNAVQGQGQLNANSLQLLASLPQFQAIRQAIQNDPNSMQDAIQQLAVTSPELYNLIIQHPQQFQRLLMGGDQDDDFNSEEQGEGMQGQGEGQLIVTQQQQQAINRLANLGFSKIEAAQAYMACDKNEQMAANLLFDRLANGDIEQSYSNNEGGDQDDDNLFN